MKDYSQYGEQHYILKALGITGPGPFTTTGRLLEIGAWDPFDKSNSRALIELGWSAVMFEPSPGPLRNLVREYGNNPKVDVFGLPVTLNGGFIELTVTDDALSAEPSNEAHLKKWGKVGGFYGTMSTWAVSLDDIMEMGLFDFISIDTEGTSVDLFRGLIERQARPRCVCVEHDAQYDPLKALCGEFGYRLAYLNDCNAVLEGE